MVSFLKSKLRVLREIFQNKKINPIETLNYIRRVDSFPNAHIAYKILLTIPIIVASSEIFFCKLKILNLRSTMSQEQLNGLAILSRERDILTNLNIKA